jgi:peroxiredoxin
VDVSTHGGVYRPNLARSRLRELADTERLSVRLRTRELPDLELTTSDSMRVPLRAHVSGLVVVYFVPGEGDGSAWVDGHPTLDAAQHRGYVNRRESFGEMGVKVFCVSSQPIEDLSRMRRDLDATHFMFSDPDMLVAHALELPTAQDGRKVRYRRLALAADGGRIRGVFPAFQGSEAAASARQVSTWIMAKYGDSTGREHAG